MNDRDKKQWEKDYLESKCIDCPWCGHDKPDHSCRNCHSEVNQKDCWKCGGYCSEKCLKYITKYLSEHIKHKEEIGVNCKCDNPQCAKCLMINCTDENCPTHSQKAKEGFRKRFNK